jgi:hypothetical protein
MADTEHIDLAQILSIADTLKIGVTHTIPPVGKIVQSTPHFDDSTDSFT